VKQITNIFLNLSNFLIDFTELQNSCTQLNYAQKWRATVDFRQNMKKIINIAYFWHVELSFDHNICLIQKFYNIYV